MKLRFPQQVESLTGSRGEAVGGLGSMLAPVAHQPVGWVWLWDGNLSCSVSWKVGTWLRSSADC